MDAEQSEQWKPSNVEVKVPKPSNMEVEAAKPNPLRFLGGEIKMSLIPSMYRKGSNYMAILEKASMSLGDQMPSAQALASAHHRLFDSDLMLTGSVMAVAMENEILKAQMKVVLQRLGEMAERVDTIDHLADKTKALMIGCKTLDEIQEKVCIPCCNYLLYSSHAY